MAENI